MESAIKAMPEKLRAVFVMRELEVLSTEATAEALDVSEEVVKTRLRWGRLWLRERLYKRLDLTEYLPPTKQSACMPNPPRPRPEIRFTGGSTDAEKIRFFGTLMPALMLLKEALLQVATHAIKAQLTPRATVSIFLRPGRRSGPEGRYTDFSAPLADGQL